MSDPLFIGLFVLLWFIVIAMALLLIALTRQIGVLHTRLAPAGALMTSAGPAVGEVAPTLALQTLGGAPVQIGGVRERVQLILFISPTCPVCKTLVPTAKSLARSDSRLELIFGSDGGEAAKHRAYVEEMKLADYPYVVSLDLGLKFEVAKLPYAVLIGADGIVRSKGLVNSREHLESLVESMDTGYTSIQDYLGAEGKLEADPT